MRSQLFKRVISLLLAVMLLLPGAVCGVAAEGEPGSETPADPCAGGHDLGDWIIRVPADCLTGETKSKQCSRCKQFFETVTGEPLGHDYETKEKKDATCTEDGIFKQVCKRCGDEKIEITKKLGHDYTEWEIIKKGDCSVDGEKKRSCKRCKETFTEIDKTAGHDFEKKVTEATCVSGGKTVYTCKKCGYSYEDDLRPALNHKYITEAAEEATCQKEGKTEKIFCERCNTVLTEAQVLPKVDHEGVREAAVEATCMKEGTTGKLVCKWCGKVLDEAKVIPVSGHNFQTEVLTPATCTAQGLSREVCKSCGETHTVITEPTGHNYVEEWIVEVTCTKAGERVRTCTNCGHQTDKQIVDALGHQLEKKWTVDKAPTCGSTGSKSHHCTRCGKKCDATTVPKNGHDYKITVKPATTKKDGSKVYLCSVCGKKVKKVVYRISSIALKKQTYTCDNKVKTPTVVVKNTANKKLTKDTDYKVTYAKGRKTPGTYTVKITFTGDYKGSKTLKFTINLAKTTGLTLSKSGSNKVKVGFDKVKGAQKYCVYYATSKNGDYKKLAEVKNLTYTTGALTRGKTYYFKVCAAAKDQNGKDVFGAYSPVSKIAL